MSRKRLDDEKLDERTLDRLSEQARLARGAILKITTLMVLEGIQKK